MYRRPASQAVLVLLFPLLLAFTTIVVAGLAGFVTIGLILGGIELLLGAVLLAALSPLIMVRADGIRIWHGFQFVNIGIGEVAGVGMLYTHTAGYGGGWRLVIWREDGSSEATGFTYLPGRRPSLPPGKRHWVRQATYDPVASSQITALNAGRAATVGGEIYKDVLAAQGPGGQLATRHLEKHQPSIMLAPYTRVIAYWSPDGDSGHCR
jgi:hypothetical protein